MNPDRNKNRTSDTSKIGGVFSKIFENEHAGLILALFVLIVIMSILSPFFLTQHNIMNVLRQVSLQAIVGIGITMIILSGEIDLSVGSAQAVVGVFSVMILNATGSLVAAFCGALLIGALIGMINGFLVTKGKINSLIGTLGMTTILRGIAMVVTEAKAVQTKNTAFQVIGTGYWGPFPIPVIITIVLIACFYYLLHYTTFGRYIYAVGGNGEASRLSGLPVHRIKLLTYIISGILTALSAFILASRMNSGQPNAGVGFEMEVIGAVILGGVSLSGGTGSLLGALIGILILGVLSNGLILLNVSSFWQDIARGAVIILAVYLDTYRKGKHQQMLVEATK